MRESIDCAVWMVPEHAGWMREFMDECARERERVKLHAVGLDGAPWDPARSPVLPAGAALRHAALGLKRYDVCLVPVTLATLGWTRMALAGAGDSMATPLLGVARAMTAAGMQDLLSLGLADFLRVPVCAEELKTRIAQWATPAGPAAIRRQAAQAAQAQAEAEDEPACPAPPADAEPFRSAKARMVTEFERRYVSGMLSQHRGNISQAARAARKNRRAFWQLMRKHDIAADGFRVA